LIAAMIVVFWAFLYSTIRIDIAFIGICFQLDTASGEMLQINK
jgi:hypothetical protein